MDLVEEAPKLRGEVCDEGAHVEEAGGAVVLVLALAEPGDDRDLRLVRVQRDGAGLRDVGVGPRSDRDALLAYDLTDVGRKGAVRGGIERTRNANEAVLVKAALDDGTSVLRRRHRLRLPRRWSKRASSGPCSRASSP